MKRNKCIITFILICTILASCHSREGCYSDDFSTYIKFRTVDGIQQFVSSVREDIKVYDHKHSQTDFSFPWSIDAQTVNIFVENLTGTMIPKPKQGVKCLSFSGRYYYSPYINGPLEISYNIGGVSYKFAYDFDDVESTSGQSEGKSQTVSIDSVDFELYKRLDERFSGSFILGNARVYVTVYADYPECIDFNDFEFMTITNDLK